MMFGRGERSRGGMPFFWCGPTRSARVGTARSALRPRRIASSSTLS